MHCSIDYLTLVAATLLDTTAAYSLVKDFGSGSTFFNNFEFFTGTDPTHGYVTYVNKATAQSAGLIKTNVDGSTYIGVDHTTVASGSGRRSVRLNSTYTWHEGLMILDLEHMPASTCGSWPAFWTVGQGETWPDAGEIDIIEGVNQATNNEMSLHTTNGCSISAGNSKGTLLTSNCYISAAGQSSNSGCSYEAKSTSSYGTNFNAIGGGQYAALWTNLGISIWFFPRTGIPLDIINGKPQPNLWGPPTANFSGNCNIPNFFGPQTIIFDITFCGDWAGAVWSSSGCASKASTCQSFVQNNPSQFADTYWSIRSLKIYQ